jgi:hypothetical protein
MPYKTICGHEWEPVEGHERRLRCKWCGALGYTRPKLPGARRRQERVFVYVCSVKGCHEPAVVVSRLGGTVVWQRCKKHKGTGDGG